jgi:hypothetical protein
LASAAALPYCGLCGWPTPVLGSRIRERVAARVSTVSAAFGLLGRAAFGSSRCQTGKGCSSKSVSSEHTYSTFLLPFTLYRCTESVTCTGSSLFAVGYAYFERHRKYSALLPFRLRQTALNPRQECQNSETPATSGPAQRQALPTFSRRHSHPRSENPAQEPNRCNLEPLKPETLKTTLYLVLAQGWLTLQVVCLGLAHFQLQVRPPKSPSPPTARALAGLGGWTEDPPLDDAGVFIAQKHDNLTNRPLRRFLSGQTLRRA